MTVCEQSSNWGLTPQLAKSSVLAATVAWMQFPPSIFNLILQPFVLLLIFLEEKKKRQEREEREGEGRGREGRGGEKGRIIVSQAKSN